MKKYLIGIISDNGTSAHIIANSDNSKPYIIRYCGSQTGNNYSTIWGAARQLEKLRNNWRKNGRSVMDVHGTPDVVSIVGCQPNWIKNYFKRGYYSII